MEGRRRRGHWSGLPPAGLTFIMADDHQVVKATWSQFDALGARDDWERVDAEWHALYAIRSKVDFR